MKANELRIGNFVFYVHDNDVWQIQGQDILFLIEGIDSECFQPIPLTEEWLVKFGFEKLYYDDNGLRLPYYRLNQNDYLFDLDYEFCATRDDGGYIYLKSVHTLQNLYFALTGEELELK